MVDEDVSSLSRSVVRVNESLRFLSVLQGDVCIRNFSRLCLSVRSPLSLSLFLSLPLYLCVPLLDGQLSKRTLAQVNTLLIELPELIPVLISLREPLGETVC